MEYTEICAEATKTRLQSFQLTDASLMVHKRSKTAWEEKGSKGKLSIGVWVNVSYDYQPGTCSDGGVGCIVGVEAAVDETDDEAAVDDAQKLTVKYLMFGRTEKDINLTRVTVIPMPFKEGTPSLRPRREKTGTPEIRDDRPIRSALGTCFIFIMPLCVLYSSCVLYCRVAEIWIKVTTP